MDKAQPTVNRLVELADFILAAISDGTLPNYQPKEPIHPDLFGGKYEPSEIQWAQDFLIRLGIFA